MAEKFDVKKPFRTRNGNDVAAHVVLDKKIMGVVQYDKQEAVFCVWMKNGNKISLYPRNKGEEHDLDLVNVEQNNG